ncbi:DUF1847 domain-containing protein [Bacilliculturomica massiliensis]|uniref:DUF1847 domain-containing protein n=1 Tax=Bacilliculturomica massiliensis TaxID=1917867 RepID=UPI0010320923|nr:DUF1847 domain-containing protein [Bacilliculturomica massiliensis]
MDGKNGEQRASCISCGVYNCDSGDKTFPPFCLTNEENRPIIEETIRIYETDEQTGRVARASAEVEGEHYCQATRVEEILYFAEKIGAKKIGIATCVGLIEESKLFAKILRAKGFQPFGVACKVGGVDKNVIGIPDEKKVDRGGYEPICNPVAQAKLLNKEGTDLNVIVGLCVGHDSLFIKYSDALVTTLVTKDRVLGHNPVAALYTLGSYYKKILR